MTLVKAPSRPRYVQVAVNAGRPTNLTFSYRVPTGREVRIGEVVHVPWGQRTLQGIVVEGPMDLPGYAGDIRDLEPPVEGAPVIGEQRLALARWVAEYYLAPPWESYALMLPPGAGERPLTSVLRGPAAAPAALSDDLGAAVDYGAVARRIVEIGTGPRVNLIERLAGMVAESMLREFPAREVRVRVRKLTAPLDGLVGTPGVELVRTR